MAAFYADENVPASVVKALTISGHDVLSAEADGEPTNRWRGRFGEGHCTEKKSSFPSIARR